MHAQQVSGALPARPVSVPASQFWHETRGLRTGQRYEFWATASTGAGEGPATRIITQSPEVRAPARIASFSRKVSVALKQDLELPCRIAGQPTPVREWRTRRPLSSPTMRVRPLRTAAGADNESGIEGERKEDGHRHSLFGGIVRSARELTKRARESVALQSSRPHKRAQPALCVHLERAPLPQSANRPEELEPKSSAGGFISLQMGKRPSGILTLALEKPARIVASLKRKEDKDTNGTAASSNEFFGYVSDSSLSFSLSFDSAHQLT
ncbi:hypothetical protein MRX96_050880 [Rhipicephalus microplus]